MKTYIKRLPMQRLVAALLALVLALGVLPLVSVETYAATTVPKPNYNGRFEVYSTYFNYYPFGIGKNTYAVDSFVFGRSATPLYMEYSANGGKTWKRTGRMDCNCWRTYADQGFKIGGLKPNKTYKTRIFYGDAYGNKVSPVLNTTTIKTGQKKKPAIKSVTCKAVSVKYHKVKHYGPYTGVYLYTEKYYSYKVKVTVKLKKKPGTKGIWVNGRWLKGNKKTYTTTFTPLYGGYSSKRPRGNIKYTVTLRSGQNKSWGGYSPIYKKTMKLK